MEQLEKLQAITIEKFKVKTKEIKSAVTKDLEETTMDAASTIFASIRFIIRENFRFYFLYEYYF